MENKPLQVKPARKIYQPKYPSYADKNPLLYPETRPYPFQSRFINCMTKGGLATILLLGGNELSAQTPRDTLYNPFPIENALAQVPYRSVSFGTGLPERLSSEEAIRAIRKAFDDSGIGLKDKVRLKEKNLDVRLDAYSEEEKIGFIFMLESNIDNSFYKNDSYSKGQQRLGKKEDLRILVKDYYENIKVKFSSFIYDKKRIVEYLTFSRPTPSDEIYAEQLSRLDPHEESEGLFMEYTLQYDLGIYREHIKNDESLAKEMFKYIDARFEDSVEKMVLWRLSDNFRNSYGVAKGLYKRYGEEFNDLCKIDSDEKFIQNYLLLSDFRNYDSGVKQLERNSTYQQLKQNIVNAHPLEEWFNNLEKLEEYHDQNYLSLSELELLGKNNEDGLRFIAPISSASNLLMLRNTYDISSQEIREERIEIQKEYAEKNGMTKERASRMKEEYKVLNEKYNWNVIKGLPKQQRDSLNKLKQTELKMIRERYESMELLTAEEKNEFKVKFNDLKMRENNWYKAKKEEVRMDAMRRLENEVKLYIKWAKSQMGG